jgi:hypothetical protein
MAKVKPPSGPPDVDAAVRGGDWNQTMDGEGVLADSTLEHALYWRKIYTEILEMEEKVLARIHEVMDAQGEQVRHEVELTNVPVVSAQVERFRQRLGYWDLRVRKLQKLKPVAK